MHGHSISTGIALAGLIVAVLALIFQVLSYRRDK
jgi:uncharacterized integral membrane protein